MLFNPSLFFKSAVFYGVGSLTREKPLGDAAPDGAGRPTRGEPLGDAAPCEAGRPTRGEPLGDAAPCGAGSVERRTTNQEGVSDSVSVSKYDQHLTRKLKHPSDFAFVTSYTPRR